MDLDIFITELESRVELLEQGREPGAPVDMEQVYSLDKITQEAQSRVYELSPDEMLRAAQMSPVYADQVVRLSSTELEDKLETARAQKDLVSLYLLSKYAPAQSIRARAEKLPTDKETMSKVGKARSLYARAKQLEAMQPWERRNLARSLGHKVQEPQDQAQGSGMTADEHYRSLKSDPMYGF